MSNVGATSGALEFLINQPVKMPANNKSQGVFAASSEPFRMPRRVSHICTYMRYQSNCVDDVGCIDACICNAANCVWVPLAG